MPVILFSFLLLFSSHSYAEKLSNSSLKIPAAATSSCTDMKQNLIFVLGVPTNSAPQQSAKFSILNARLQAYKEACGQIDLDLVDRIFQSN